jgi:hypothetical protein
LSVPTDSTALWPAPWLVWCAILPAAGAKTLSFKKSILNANSFDHKSCDCNSQHVLKVMSCKQCFLSYAKRRASVELMASHEENLILFLFRSSKGLLRCAKASMTHRPDDDVRPIMWLTLCSGLIVLIHLLTYQKMPLCVAGLCVYEPVYVAT